MMNMCIKYLRACVFGWVGVLNIAIYNEIHVGLHTMLVNTFTARCLWRCSEPKLSFIDINRLALLQTPAVSVSTRCGDNTEGESGPKTCAPRRYI